MTNIASDLASGKCKPCEGGVAPLKEQEVSNLLKQLDGWEYANGRIAKTYSFKNYYQTMAFVNAAAWISHREDHHPDMDCPLQPGAASSTSPTHNGCPRTILSARRTRQLFDL